MGRHSCKACTFTRNGVKTRIAIEHTCAEGTYTGPVKKHQYIPTREELDKYLAKLKELMDPDDKENGR